MNSDKNRKGTSILSGIRSAALAQDFPYRRLMRVLAVALAAALIAGASVFGVTRPFGLALIAASDGVSMTAAAFAGAVLGAAAQPDFSATAAAAALLFAARLLTGVLLRRAAGQGSSGKRLSDRKKHPLPTGPTGAAENASARENTRPTARAEPDGGRRGVHNTPPPSRGYADGRPPESGRNTGASSLLAAAGMAGAWTSESVWLRMAFGATAAMVSGALRIALGGTWQPSTLLAVFFSAIVVPLVTLAFCTLTERQLSLTGARDAGLLVLLFAAVRALRDAEGLPFNAGIVCAFAASMLAARGGVTKDGRALLPDSRRIMAGALCGVVCGLAMDPGGAPIYAAAALAAGILYRFSPAAAVCGGWLSAVGISFAGGGLLSFAAMMPEVTVTAALLVPLFQFDLIPARLPVLGACCGGRSTDAPRGQAAEEAAIAGGRADFGVSRMRSLSASFHALSGMLAAVSEKLRRPGVLELKELCDASFDERCAQCENQSLCWEREYASTADTVCRMTSELHKNGRVSAAVIPPSLASRCHRMNDILDAVNEGCARRAESAMKTDRSDVFAGDFEAFAALLDDAARDTDDEFAPDEELSRKLQRSLKYMDFYAGSVTVYGTRRRRIMARDLDLTRVRMGGEDIRRAFEKATGAHLGEPEYSIDGETVSMQLCSVPCVRTEDGSATRAAGENGRDAGRRPPNGDCAIRFETEDGRYYMLICDGMGTGGEASVTARLSAAFLEETLRGGASMQSALTMLNNYMRSRSMECSAGIDLMEIDRYTGEARFVKSGAAPSFVSRQGRLFRLCSKTVPIGILRALDAELIRFTLEPGDVIVMLSDGVTENFEESPWLCDMLASGSVMSAPPGEIAQRIVRAAASGGERRRDDITAAVVKIA